MFAVADMMPVVRESWPCAMIEALRVTAADKADREDGCNDARSTEAAYVRSSILLQRAAWGGGLSQDHGKSARFALLCETWRTNARIGRN